jgi:hypothetical protein
VSCPLGRACVSSWKAAADSDCYFTALETEANVPLRLLPVPFNTAMMATAMPEAIRPYSMAVAPDSSLKKATSLSRIMLTQRSRLSEP